MKFELNITWTVSCKQAQYGVAINQYLVGFWGNVLPNDSQQAQQFGASTYNQPLNKIQRLIPRRFFSPKYPPELRDQDDDADEGTHGHSRVHQKKVKNPLTLEDEHVVGLINQVGHGVQATIFRGFRDPGTVGVGHVKFVIIAGPLSEWIAEDQNDQKLPVRVEVAVVKQVSVGRLFQEY